MPMPVSNREQRTAFRQTLRNQAKHVKWFLINEWKTPPEIVEEGSRFPCKTYHHPGIVKLMVKSSLMMQFREVVLEIIDQPHELTAANLFSILMSSEMKAAVVSIVKNPQTVGNLLAEWRRFYPSEIIGPVKKHPGNWFWQIIPISVKRRNMEPWSIRLS
jgi:hypothetical protein